MEFRVFSKQNFQIQWTPRKSGDTMKLGVFQISEEVNPTTKNEFSVVAGIWVSDILEVENSSEVDPPTKFRKL